ncbi:TP901 family phage tail tape measure protein [Bacillus cereus]|nr:TP901 family phage tail tape measure protein [Bacillus cereus]
MANERFNIDVVLNDSRFQSGVRNMTQGLRQVEGDSNRAGKAGLSMGTAFTTAFKSMAGITAVVGGFRTVETAIAGVVKGGMDYSFQMSKVAAVTQGSAFEMTQLGAKARELGASTNWTATNVAEGMEYMALAGFNTGQIISGIAPMLNLATAGALDLGKAADIVTDTMTPFNMAAEEATRVADVMAIAQASANLNVEMLGETMKYAAPVANAFGMSLEDTTNVAMQFANGGIKASMAGTALRAGLSRLAEPPKPAADALAKLGIETTKADGTMQSMRDIIGQLSPKFAELTNQQQIASAKAIFGEEAYAGWMMVINNGLDTWDDFDDILQTSGGSAEVMAGIMANNLTGAANATKSAMENLGLVLFSRMEGGLIAATKGAGNLTTAVTDMIDPTHMAAEANDYARKIEQERAQSMALLEHRHSTGKINQQQYEEGVKKVNERYKQQQTESGRVKIELEKLDEQLKTGKITQEQYDKAKEEAEIHSKKLQAALKQEEEKQKQYGEVIKWLQGIFKALWDYVQPMWKDMSKFINEQITKIKNFIKNNGEEIKIVWEAIMTVVKFVSETVWGGIKKIISGALDIIMGAIQIFGGIVKGDWGKVWEGVKNVGKGIWDLITGIFDATFVKGLLNAAGKMGVNLVKSITESFMKKKEAVVKWTGESLKAGVKGITDMVKGMGDKAKGVIKAVTNPVKDAVKSIGNLGKDFLNVGKNLITNLINGITSKMGSLGNKIKDVAGMLNPMNWFKAAIPVDPPEFPEGEPMTFASPASQTFSASSRSFASGADTLGAVTQSLNNLAKPVEWSSSSSSSSPSTGIYQDSRPIEIVVVSELDGREIARSTARYTKDELARIDNRAVRGKGGSNRW